MSDLAALVVQQSLNGVYLGCLYVMVALGLTLIYGVLNQLHIAHADFVTVGAFTAFFTLTRLATKLLGLPDTAAYLLSIVAAFGMGALLGLAINAAVFAPLRERGDELRPLIATIGVSVLLENAQLRSEEHTSELQSQSNLVCRLLLEKKNARISWPPYEVCCV